MNKKPEGVIIWVVLAGALFFALRLPFLVYGGAPEIHDDVLQPRYTPTPLSAERAMTQQAFAMMFFTPTYTLEPTQPFLAFLLPNTGATQTNSPTPMVMNTATFSATPTRTLLPVYSTRTQEQGGGGPVIPPPASQTFIPIPTSSAVSTTTDTPEPPPSDTPEPPPSDTPEPPPSDTPEPPNPPGPPGPPDPPGPPGGNNIGGLSLFLLLPVAILFPRFFFKSRLFREF